MTFDSIWSYSPSSEESRFLCSSDMQTQSKVLVTSIKERKRGDCFE